MAVITVQSNELHNTVNTGKGNLSGKGERIVRLAF